jgi:hypothetical protein
LNNLELEKSNLMKQYSTLEYTTKKLQETTQNLERECTRLEKLEKELPEVESLETESLAMDSTTNQLLQDLKNIIDNFHNDQSKTNI